MFIVPYGDWAKLELNFQTVTEGFEQMNPAVKLSAYLKIYFLSYGIVSYVHKQRKQSNTASERARI